MATRFSAKMMGYPPLRECSDEMLLKIMDNAENEMPHILASATAEVLRRYLNGNLERRKDA